MTYVRVKQVDTGHEISVPESHYKAQADAYELLEKPAEDLGGEPLQRKYKTTVSTEAARKRGQQAEKKETD